MRLRRTTFDGDTTICRENTVRAGIVEKAWQWKWSSAAVHIGRPTEQCPLGTKAFKPYN
ncbi:MAG: hypothetical protein HZC52_05625 [Planctomycetes bacterium]|uniref:hypothetical protein n=1 Tax=Candidatus Wunengus sp. YC65 TaxID=3367701 RepID=UPI001DAB1250|nr:hypothetical protein [Planctomycetota bacterium]